MRQPDLTKELPPMPAGTDGHVESGYTPLSRQLMYKGYEVWAERELSKGVFTSLCTEADYLSGKVYVRQWQARFTKAASLMPSDKVTDPHPIVFVPKSVQDKPVLSLRDAWLAWTSVPADTEPDARVDGREAASDSLVHNDTEEVDFVKRRVLGRAAATLLCVLLLPPVYVVSDMLSSKLAGDKNVPHTQVGGHVTPHSLVPCLGVGGVRVALPQESRNPVAPEFVLLKPCLFLLRCGLDEFMRTGAIECNPVTVERGLLLASASGGVNESNPPVGGLRSLEQIRHCKRVLHTPETNQVLPSVI
jgi:hypothetical protein